MISPFSVAFSLHHPRFPGALMRQQDIHCFATNAPEPETYDDRLFLVAPSLLLVLLVIVQSVLPAYVANARTASPFAAQSAGCISPSDCVAKMTLPEKEGQMTQVENNAFTMAGNSITDITTYFIGSVLSGGGGGPHGVGGTATQWADMVDNFQSYALKSRLSMPLI